VDLPAAMPMPDVGVVPSFRMPDLETRRPYFAQLINTYSDEFPVYCFDLPSIEYYDSVASKMKFSVALGLFIGGIVSFAIFFAVPSHPTYLALSGWTAWVFAYFSVLAQNFKEKAPIPARGGIVRFEERPHLYRILYWFLYFLGAFALLVIFLVNLAHQ
jgi:hypothetical protein